MLHRLDWGAHWLCRLGCLCACVWLLQGCSAVRLGYPQLPHWVHWQLDRYVNLTEPQSERVREELAQLHAWHRSTVLPQHAQLLAQWQAQWREPMSPQQVCAGYELLRLQLERVVARMEPALAWLVSDLSEAQWRQLQKRQFSENAQWRREWLEPSPQALLQHRWKRLLSRAESLYGPLEPAQKEALRAALAQSSWDPQRSYAERLRRQQDLLQLLQNVALERGNGERTRGLLQAYLARLSNSPDPLYEQAARTWQQEQCAAFAQLHNGMTAAQRHKAMLALARYEQEFTVLAQP